MSSNMESAVVEVPLFSAFAVGFSQSSAGFMTSRHPRRPACPRKLYSRGEGEDRGQSVCTAVVSK
jgi:hypothetical protein